MLILSIDSSATAASAALTDDSKLIGEFFTNTDFTHSRTLAPMIESLLQVTDKKVSEIDAVAVSNGPGSFTGVRIGVAVAKGIAFPDDIPCMGVSTLESMAYNLTLTDCVVCAAMDARRNQVYNAMFRIQYGEVYRLCDDRAISLIDLKAEITEKYNDDRIILVGDGAQLALRELMDLPLNVELAPESLRYQRASSVALAARARIKAGEKPSAHSELLPSYLRLSQAERERKEREQKASE
ncbi:MAG: tRNA (adenosine(37)-N6)-threonylcarbamoyltransferase complex dimerization subunit type 1 TsaB [Clostridia bacterium]|nr:tRNA (adenosine(37)-N6)-threonylcarbamoyltransferase complex dimerization subunit type 1 TsaB [Clostridia bacterium]